MAQIAAAFASSHSVMLTAELDDWLTRFVAADQRISHFDAAGNPCTYGDLLARASAQSAALVTKAAIERRFDDAQAAMARMKTEILSARLDAMIIVGDDQREIFSEMNQPALAIYYGETIRNAAARDDLPPGEWYKRAQNRRRDPGGPVDYPCQSALGLYLIEELTRRGFDITAIKQLGPDEAEGHAYSFVHYKYIGGSGLPIVPILLNTYYPPNQPTPERCLALGSAIAELVRTFPAALRIGIMASGGLSHFTVDEQLDRQVIDAMRRKDMDFLAALPPRKLQAGSSEIRNWLVVAAAAANLELSWVSYVPGYRTPALTGTGLGFARWS
jgi:3-O-methylgallate 3,4-dioxygenase